MLHTHASLPSLGQKKHTRLCCQTKMGTIRAAAPGEQGTTPRTSGRCVSICTREAGWHSFQCQKLRGVWFLEL